MPGLRQPAAWGGRRAAWGAVAGATNAIDRLTYDVAYEGSGVSGGNWAPASAGSTLVSNGTNPTIGQSTTGWSNLPDRLVDDGVIVGSAELQNDTFDFADADFHNRILIDLDAAAVNGTRIWRYLVAGTRLAEVRLISHVNIQFTVRFDASGGLYTGTAAGAGFPTGALLIDWGVDVDQMFLYINGVDFSPAANPGGAIDFPNPAGDTFTLFGPLVLSNSIMPFIGFRWGGTISLADHQSDAEDLGLFTP